MLNSPSSGQSSTAQNGSQTGSQTAGQTASSDASSAPSKPNVSASAQLDSKTALVLARMYLEKRIKFQSDYYEKRSQEYERNSDTLFRANALIISLTTLLAALGTQTTFPAGYRLFTALLPAFAGLLTAVSQLHKWDEQTRIYRDSLIGLEKAKLVLPDMDVLDGDTALQIFPTLVEKAEGVFYDEVNQWGQVTVGQDENPDDSIIKFAEQYGLDIFDENGKVDQSKLGYYKDLFAVANSGNKGLSGTLNLQKLTADFSSGNQAPAQVSAPSSPQLAPPSFTPASTPVDISTPTYPLSSGTTPTAPIPGSSTDLRIEKPSQPSQPSQSSQSSQPSQPAAPTASTTVNTIPLNPVVRPTNSSQVPYDIDVKAQDTEDDEPDPVTPQKPVYVAAASNQDDESDSSPVAAGQFGASINTAPSSTSSAGTTANDEDKASFSTEKRHSTLDEEDDYASEADHK